MQEAQKRKMSERTTNRIQIRRMKSKNQLVICIKGGDIMGRSRMVLMIVGVLILLMGILGVLDLDYATEPMWHAILKIIVGLVALAVAYMDKGA
jgi:hypothetical protein